jgi:hypothetical protein
VSAIISNAADVQVSAWALALVEQQQGSFVGLARTYMYTPYMTVYLVTSLPKTPYIHRMYRVLANPTHLRIPSQCLP